MMASPMPVQVPFMLKMGAVVWAVVVWPVVVWAEETVASATVASVPKAIRRVIRDMATSPSSPCGDGSLSLPNDESFTADVLASASVVERAIPVAKFAALSAPWSSCGHDFIGVGSPRNETWAATMRRCSPDIFLGDADGVLVIPAALADEIAEKAFEQTAFEDFVAEQVSAGHGIYSLYPPTGEQTLTAFAAWRKLKGR